MDTINNFLTLGIALLIAALPLYFQAKVLRAEKAADKEKVIKQIWTTARALTYTAAAVIFISISILFVISLFSSSILCPN